MPEPLTLYLAGPMRGYDQFNFPAFHAAAADLRSRGYMVLSPAEHDEEEGFDPTLNTLEGFSLTGAMRWDIGCVLHADAVAVLPGWQASSGVGIEVMVARAIGIPVLDAATLLPASEEPVNLEAHRIINGQRRKDYGGPRESFERIAALWGAVLGIPISAHQVVICMIQLKVARAMNGFHRDSFVDIAGYAGCAQMVDEEML